MGLWGGSRQKGTRWNNRPTRGQFCGVMHQSAMEAARCDELHAMQAGGLICDLEEQPKIPLVVNHVHVGDYIADFAYTDVSGEVPVRVVEDVKGRPGDTQLYRLKRRLVLALHGIDVQEVRRVRGRR